MKHLILLVMLFTVPAIAQRPTFTAEANTSKIIMGEPFQVSFRLSNAEAQSFTPPSFDGFTVVQSGSKQFSQYSYGKTSSVKEWSYSVVATRKGTLKIGTARVMLGNGKKLDSRPIKIEVVSSKNGGTAQQDSPLKDLIIFRMEVNKENAVVGEQITIDLKLYSRWTGSPPSLKLLKEPEFPNMFSQAVFSFDDREKREEFNGKMYISKTLRRLIIFPNQSGQLSLEPAIIRAEIAEDDPNMPGFKRLIPYNLHTNDVNLMISELDGAPQGFQGTIGKYNMQAHLSQNSIKSDDVLQLTVRVKGHGDLKQVMPPIFNLSKEQFEIYPPNIKEEAGEANGLLGGVKTFEYIIAPKVPEAINTDLIPSFVFYNPDLKEFVRLDTNISINVAAGQRKSVNPAMDSTTAEASTDNSNLSLGEPMVYEALRSTKTKPFWGSTLFWLLNSSPLFLYLFFLTYRQMMHRLGLQKEKKVIQIDPTHQRVKESLREAKQLINSSNSGKFYSSIANTLLVYVGGVLKLSNVKLSKHSIQKGLQDKQVTSELIQQFTDLMSTCEIAAFAGGLHNSNSPQTTYDQAQNLLADLEKAIQA
ncbi:MAG: BatD family protein [Saprospiraceae bacterium]|nr:BatD family protein [Saprospiraceae bacterium]